MSALKLLLLRKKESRWCTYRIMLFRRVKDLNRILLASLLIMTNKRVVTGNVKVPINRKWKLVNGKFVKRRIEQFRILGIVIKVNLVPSTV